MSQLGLLYEGVRWDIPSEAGITCRSYLSMTQRFFETLFFTIIYGSLLLWCIPRLKLPFGRRFTTSRHLNWIKMIHCLIFGIELGYKLTARSLIFVLNPCHALTAIQASATQGIISDAFKSLLIFLTPCLSNVLNI